MVAAISVWIKTHALGERALEIFVAKISVKHARDCWYV
jgi:hypothetical protein